MTKIKKAMTENKQTTIAGALAVLIPIIQCAIALLDNDPATVPNWEIAMANVAIMYGLFRSQDAK